VVYAEVTPISANKVSTSSSTTVHKKSCRRVITVGLFLRLLIFNLFKTIIPIEMQLIHIGSDHAGFALKEQLKNVLKAKYNVIDYGPISAESVDYPDYAHPVATAVEQQGGLGILICGSANGVAMAANKHAAIRAAICWLPEIASLARQHNDANIVCIPARFISEQEAEQIVDVFLTTEFEGGRHENRVKKIACN
jgi:ribose 5-phosphate isomerase B